MAIEDFTTYTEVEENNHITVDGDGEGLTLVGRRDETCYIYKDYGAGYFGDFEHLVTVKVYTSSGSNTRGANCWAMTNDLGDEKGLRVYFY